MAPLWKLEYWEDPNWVEITGKLTQIMEELKGHEQADIILPNTSTNRDFVDSDQTIKISFDENEVFTGSLMDYEMTATRLKCILYNAVYETMKSKTITADYSSGASADTIFAAICAAAGVTAGTCPTTSILGVKFIDAQCYMAAVFLSDILNSDFSASNGTFNIAARGQLKTATHYKIVSRAKSRAQVRNKVRVRGVSIVGLPIVGEAGTGDKVTVKIENKVSDVASLTLLAAKYLAELNTDSKGAPLIYPITEGFAFKPGDTFAVTNAQYKLDGTYPMKRVTKTSTKVTSELDVAKQTLEQLILDFDKYQEYGIYYVSGSITPTILSWQDLELYQYFNEGTDLFIYDYGPYWRQGIGHSITWTAGPSGKSCTFNGTDSCVICGNDFNIDDETELTVGVWVTPTDAQDGFIISRFGNFYLKCNSDNSVTAHLDMITQDYEASSPAGSLPVGIRTHVVMRWVAGTTLQIIINNAKVAEITTAQDISLSDPGYELTVGAETWDNQDERTDSYFNGQLDNLVIFKRGLTDGELANLYNYSKTCTPPPAKPSNEISTKTLLYHFHMNEGSGNFIHEASDPAIIGTIRNCTWNTGINPTLQFGAFGNVEIPNLTLGGTNKVSVGMWIVPCEEQNLVYVFHKAGELLIRVDNDSVGPVFYIASGQHGPSCAMVMIKPLHRYFVMVTYDGAFIKTFVNGTERSRLAQTGLVETGSSTLIIGAADNAGTNGFLGSISELMIWRE